MAPNAGEYRKQAEDALRWAEDCEAVAKRLRAQAAELLAMADKSAPVIQQQQQTQPEDAEDK